MKYGIKLNEKNTIVSVLWLKAGNYSKDYIAIDTDKEIIPFKQSLETTYTNSVDEKGNVSKIASYKIIDLPDYSREYYAIQKQVAKNDRIFEINNWFNKYDMQVKQYDRAKRLGLDNEIHIGDKIYKTIEELDTQANLYVKELNSLKA